MTGAPQDILRRRALEYHLREDRGSSCGSMAIDMDLLLSGLVAFAEDDARLHVTRAGRKFLASGMSAFGQDREAGLEAKPASPVGEAETPNLSSPSLNKEDGE
jgi:hypothetical protein